MACVHRTRLIQGDGLAFLESYPFNGSEFVYCDPPYLLSTRGNRKRYRHEMTDAEHGRLLAIIRGLPCHVLLSGYPSPFYDAGLPGWNREEFDVMTRGHTWAREVLWFNYPRPAAIHDASLVGINWRERQRIEKRCKRWKNRIVSLEPMERAALFSALVDVIDPATILGAAAGLLKRGA